MTAAELAAAAAEGKVLFTSQRDLSLPTIDVKAIVRIEAELKKLREQQSLMGYALTFIAMTCLGAWVLFFIVFGGR